MSIYADIEEELMMNVNKHRDSVEKNMINMTRDDAKQIAIGICTKKQKERRESCNIPPFQASDGWLSRLQKRRNIRFRRKAYKK